MTETIINLETVNPIEFFGVNNSKFDILKKKFPLLKILSRGTQIKLSGAPEQIDLAKEMLQILLHSLPATLAELEQLMRSRQLEPLIQLVHKLHGASCYTGVPYIKQLTELIETELKQGKSIEQLEPELFELQDRLQALLDESLHWSW